MSSHIKSLLSTHELKAEDVYRIFEKASFLQQMHSKADPHRISFSLNKSKVVASLFFEPSTRTRLSFDFAANRLNLGLVDFGEKGSTSLSKGETLVDTVRNICAMGPDVLVIRYGIDPEVDSELKKLKIPVINAGSGITSHPTQALLDAFTIYRELGTLKNQRVLIVGDISHGRVAQSNIELLPKLGAEVAVCAPDYWMPQKSNSFQNFSDLEDGLKWATVVMPLRVQKERHSQESHSINMNEYIANYGITAKRLKFFTSSGILMHPGPVNVGVELDVSALADKRNRILDQVNNGVWIRASVFAEVLNLNLN
jgi:aspartate carbamoyltransferase catalytic subunit